MNPHVASFKAESQKIIEFLHKEFAKLQTGRANASLVEHISVEAYGQKQELRAVAGISIQDARTIVVQPWDRGIMTQVEAALEALNLGTHPQSDGIVIRIILPSMTEERRKELVKIVHTLAEEARISVRKARQDAQDKIKQEKDEDVKFTQQDALDKAVKEANERIEQSMKQKEEEVMKV